MICPVVQVDEKLEINNPAASSGVSAKNGIFFPQQNVGKFTKEN